MRGSPRDRRASSASRKPAEGHFNVDDLAAYLEQLLKDQLRE